MSAVKKDKHNSSVHQNINSRTFNLKMINPVVFYGAAMIIITFTSLSFIYPNAVEDILGVMVSWVTDTFGWFYLLTATVSLVFVIMLAWGKTGKIKLGPDYSKPRYNIFTWTSMLFAAGIGIDLLFFSVSGPVNHYLMPPEGFGGSDEAARQAIVWTLFHYGISGWAMYTLIGLAFGIFAYRYHLPLSIRATLYPIFGKRIHGITGDTFEIAAVLGTIFGIATSLGIGVVQLNYGLHLMFGVNYGWTAQLALILISVVMATISTISGVDKGIRRLSELNVLLALGLVFYILFTGKTKFLLNAFVLNAGDFVSRFPGMTLNSFAYGDAGTWLSDWTLFFWAWWIAWVPFVGLFLARISRGRTIREFVIGTLTVPFLFILIFISIFGNSSIGIVMSGNGTFGHIAVNQPEQGFYTLLEQFPAAPFIVVIATFLGLLFYVTSADSGALVMSNFTSKTTSTNSDGPPWMRIFWSVATGALTLAMLMVGGINALQYATVIIGLPFSIVLYFIMIGLYRVLKRERQSSDFFQHVLPSVPSSQVVTDRNGSSKIRETIANMMSYPDENKTQRFMDETVQPALRVVQKELEGHGAVVHVKWSAVEGTNCSSATFTVHFTDMCKFTYEVLPMLHSTQGLLNKNHGSEHYFRIHVFTPAVSMDYDIYGMTQEQLIDDLLDNFERYVEFLHQIEEPGARDIVSRMLRNDRAVGAVRQVVAGNITNSNLR